MRVGLRKRSLKKQSRRKNENNGGKNPRKTGVREAMEGGSFDKESTVNNVKSTETCQIRTKKCAVGLALEITVTLMKVVSMSEGDRSQT